MKQATSLFIFSAILCLVIIGTVFAEESNATVPAGPGVSTSVVNDSFANNDNNNNNNNSSPSEDTNVSQPPPIPPSSSNTTTNNSLNATPIAEPIKPDKKVELKPVEKVEPVPLVTDFYMSKVFPTVMNVGESQFNIQITNSGTAPLEHLSAIVTGDGVSMRDVVPIDRLNPGEQAYVIVFLTLSNGGKIPLSIHIQNKEFKSTLQVTDPTQAMEVIAKKQDVLRHQQKLAALTKQVNNVSAVYESFDHEFVERKSQGYVFPDVSFDRAKEYLRDAQSGIAKDDLINTEANIVLIESELREIRQRLDVGKLPVKTWKDSLRENVPWIAATLSIIVAMFAIIDNIKKHRPAFISEENKPAKNTKKRKSRKRVNKLKVESVQSSNGEKQQPPSN